MSLLTNCIKNKDTKTIPIWVMRQAGWYVPEFRERRKRNTDFLNMKKVWRLLKYQYEYFNSYTNIL